MIQVLFGKLAQLQVEFKIIEYIIVEGLLQLQNKLELSFLRISVMIKSQI